MCFPDGEFIVGDVDLLLGVIEGCPFYIDARIYRSWDDAELVLDVAPGDPEGFSVGPGDGQHFVTRGDSRGTPSRRSTPAVTSARPGSRRACPAPRLTAAPSRRLTPASW